MTCGLVGGASAWVVSASMMDTRRTRQGLTAAAAAAVAGGQGASGPSRSEHTSNDERLHMLLRSCATLAMERMGGAEEGPGCTSTASDDLRRMLHTLRSRDKWERGGDDAVIPCPSSSSSPGSPMPSPGSCPTSTDARRKGLRKFLSRWPTVSLVAELSAGSPSSKLQAAAGFAIMSGCAPQGDEREREILQPLSNPEGF